MNNDLISRSALLKSMEEERQYLLARGQTGAEHIIVHHCLPIIDNAPIVERPQGDLISRTELKKCAIPCEIHNGALTELCVPLYQIDNAPTVERPIRCKDCKHQTKYWHEDKRMEEGGYWVYGCDFIADPFVSASVSGEPDEYCSSAEKKGGTE